MSEVMDRKMTQSVAGRNEAPPQAISMMNVIATAATNPECDVAKMQALLDMQSQLLEREARAEFSRAMIAASGEIPQIERLGTASMGGKGSYRFARWEDMDRAIRPILTSHGLRLSFTTQRGDDGAVIVIGTASHLNGQSQAAEFVLPPDRGPGRNEAQSFGSSLSYGKRYCAEMLFNIVRRDEDKDGAFQAQKSEPVISVQQKEELIQLLQKSGKDSKQFLAWVQARTLDEMTVPQFERGRGGLLKAINGAAR